MIKIESQYLINVSKKILIRSANKSIKYYLKVIQFTVPKFTFFILTYNFNIHSPKSMQAQAQKYHAYQVSNVQNYKWYQKWGCLVSQLEKYIGTHLALFFSMILYYVVTAPYSNAGLIAVSVIFHILSTFILIVLAYKDPGIMPKILNSYQTEQYKHIPIPKGYITGDVQNTQKIFQVTTKTHLLRLKFCNYCYVYRPPRTSHCYECNMCIQRYDHHCPWIGSCVGKRNYKWFFSFVLSLALLQLFLLIQILIIVTHGTSKVNVGYLVMNIILGIIVILAMLFVYALLGFHTYFSFFNITTYQFCKKSWEVASGNPFKKSQFLKNISKIFVSPNTKKYQPKLTLKERDKLQKQKQLESQQKLNSAQKEGKKKKRKTAKTTKTKTPRKSNQQSSQTQRSVQLKPQSQKSSIFQNY